MDKPKKSSICICVGTEFLCCNIFYAYVLEKGLKSEHFDVKIFDSTQLFSPYRGYNLHKSWLPRSHSQKCSTLYKIHSYLILLAVSSFFLSNHFLILLPSLSLPSPILFFPFFSAFSPPPFFLIISKP